MDEIVRINLTKAAWVQVDEKLPFGRIVFWNLSKFIQDVTIYNVLFTWNKLLILQE